MVSARAFNVCCLILAADSASLTQNGISPHCKKTMLPGFSKDYATRILIGDGWKLRKGKPGGAVNRVERFVLDKSCSKPGFNDFEVHAD